MGGAVGGVVSAMKQVPQDIMQGVNALPASTRQMPADIAKATLAVKGPSKFGQAMKNLDLSGVTKALKDHDRPQQGGQVASFDVSQPILPDSFYAPSSYLDKYIQPRGFYGG